MTNIHICIVQTKIDTIKIEIDSNVTNENYYLIPVKYSGEHGKTNFKEKGESKGRIEN